MTHIDSSPIQFAPDLDAPLNSFSRKPEGGGGKNGFAEVFAGMSLEPQRLPAADLSKAPRQPESDLLVNPLLLQQIDLSPAMRLIMPATPAPDLASLQAFARSQGLDEEAIQQLLGDSQADPQAASTGPVAPSSTAAAETPVPEVPAAALAVAAMVGLPTLSMAMVSEVGAELPPANVSLPGLLPPGLLPIGLVRAAQTTRMSTASSEAAAPGQNAWTQPVEVISLDLTVAEVPVATDDLPEAALPTALTAGQAGMPRLWLLPKDATTPLTEKVSAASGLAVVSRPAEATTVMAGDLARLDLVAMATGETIAAKDVSTLQIDLLTQPLPTEARSGQEGMATVARPLALNDAAATVARVPAEVGLPARSVQELADNLSEKMGEAIAKRLISRLEQGNWQFRFVLHPKTMGEVQVNLNMQGGGLEGNLVSTHAATRELLSDGLQRLRDALSASGMNVASLDVGAGHSSRQGQQSMAAAVAQPLMEQRGQSGVNPEELAQARHRGSFGGEQGWDVLV